MTKITLHNWQSNALKEWIKNKGHGYVEAPTGSGKTFLGLKLMKKESLSPFLIIVPTVELKEQWKQKIKNYYPDTVVSGVGGGEKYNGYPNTLDPSQRKIIVAIINSIRHENIKAKTLILDEIHHYSSLAPINFQIWNNIKYKYILGLSATPIPERLSEADTGWNIPLVYKYSLPDTYRDGVLLKPKIIIQSVKLEENEQQDYNCLTEKIKSKMGSFNTFAGAPPYFKRWTFERNEILFGSKRKLVELRSILTNNTFKKCIVFTERIDTLEAIKNEVRNCNIEYLSIHSGMKKKKRKEVIDKFINTTEPIVLANIHIFEEGLSIPQIDLLILYSYNSTKRQSVQRVGRSLHNKDTTPKIYILYYEDTKEKYNAKKIKGIFE